MKSEAEVMKMFERAIRCYVKATNEDTLRRFLTKVNTLQEVLELDEATVTEMMSKEIDCK